MFDTLNLKIYFRKNHGNLLNGRSLFYPNDESTTIQEKYSIRCAKCIECDHQLIKEIKLHIFVSVQKIRRTHLQKKFTLERQIKIFEY